MSARPLAGRVALVTGSTAGLGRVIALELGERGAAVALNYQNDDERAASCFEGFARAGHRGQLVRANVTEADEVARLASEVEATLGSIDIVVVNATPTQPYAELGDHSWADYEAMLEFFVKSPLLLAQVLAPAMKAKGFGRIINVGSEVATGGVANMSAYVSAKAAQHGWTQCAALELGAWGVTVNMVSPGWIPVERHRDVPAETLEHYRARVPAGRLGTPRDVSGAIAYLASPEAGFINGENILVNGGARLG